MEPADVKREMVDVGSSVARVLQLLRLRFPSAAFDFDARDDGVTIGTFWADGLALCLEPRGGGWRCMDILANEATLCYGLTFSGCLKLLEAEIRGSMSAEFVARFLPEGSPDPEAFNSSSAAFGHRPAE